MLTWWIFCLFWVTRGRHPRRAHLRNLMGSCWRCKGNAVFVLSASLTTAAISIKFGEKCFDTPVFVIGWEVPNSLEGVLTNPSKKGNLSFSVVSIAEEAVKLEVTILLQRYEWWWIIGQIFTIGLNYCVHSPSLFYAFSPKMSSICTNLPIAYLSHNYGHTYLLFWIMNTTKRVWNIMT